MHKKIIPSLYLIIFVLLGVSFNSNNKIASNRSIVECAPENITTNISYTRAPTALKIRKSYNSLSNADKAQISLAISKMKALSISNPSDVRGWDYQVKIHFENCKHASCYFLAWHRMYIYYFERILQSFMDPALPKPALPYWNHKANRSIPSEFISDLTLKNTSRDISTYNATFKIPKSINTAYRNALYEKDYFSFRSKIENAHDGVHQAINGDMMTWSSPKDAIFWIHHANVDRQWEIWRNKKYGRCNPTQLEDPIWWAQTFTFYNENGIAETLSCGQIISTTSAALGYEYEGISTTGYTSTCKRKTLDCPDIVPSAIARIILPNNKVENREVTYNYASVINTNFDSALKKLGNNFDFSNNPNSIRVVLSFEDIVATKYPNGVVEVYVHRKDKTAFDATDASFVGFLPLFSATTLAAHKMHGKKNKLELEINDVLKNLLIKPTNFKNLKISFIVRGNEIDGIEVPIEADITIGKTIISLFKN